MIERLTVLYTRGRFTPDRDDVRLDPKTRGVSDAIAQLTSHGWEYTDSERTKDGQRLIFERP